MIRGFATSPGAPPGWNRQNAARGLSPWVRRVASLAMVACLLPGSAGAACFRKEPGTLWNYNGDLSNSLRIRMTLVFEGSRLRGRYTYATQLKDIGLEGTVRDGRDVVLEEKDAAGRVAARFTGRFAERDPRGRYGDSPLTCDVITGVWQREGATDQRPFYVHSVDATSGSLNHRYGAAGARDDDRVHRNAARFQEAVKRGDKSAVAAQITYPIRIEMDGKAKTLRSPGEFVRHYDAILTPRTRAAILDDIPRYMFVRDEGIMLANGIVWFGTDGRVISLVPLR
jgi:hypothetical protein